METLPKHLFWNITSFLEDRNWISANKTLWLMDNPTQKVSLFLDKFVLSSHSVSKSQQLLLYESILSNTKTLADLVEEKNKIAIRAKFSYYLWKFVDSRTFEVWMRRKQAETWRVVQRWQKPGLWFGEFLVDCQKEEGTLSDFQIQFVQRSVRVKALEYYSWVAVHDDPQFFFAFLPHMKREFLFHYSNVEIPNITAARLARSRETGEVDSP